MAKETVNSPKKSSRKRRIAFIALALIIGSILGGGYLLNKQLTGPSVGSAVSNLPSQQRTEPIELKQFDGNTFSFVMPMSYIEQVRKPEKNTTTIESRTFVSSSMVSKVITVVVSPLPSNKLEDDPSYVMRTQNPDKYKMTSAVLKNEKVMIATTSDGQQHQQTAFWVHGGKLMTFTMSGLANNATALSAEYQDMIGTISWR